MLCGPALLPQCARDQKTSKNDPEGLPKGFSVSCRLQHRNPPQLSSGSGDQNVKLAEKEFEGKLRFVQFKLHSPIFR